MADAEFTPDDLEHVVAWYTDIEDEEHRMTRIAHTRLESLRTKDIIIRVLPDTAGGLRILDVGGAAGHYAGWLAAAGHRVDLIDPVPRHVAAAQQLPGVSAALGDARALQAPDDSYDLVLLLGPLYHLSTRADRVAALAEAGRVGKPGAPVLAAAIGRYCATGEFMLSGKYAPPVTGTLNHLIATGENVDSGGFPLGHAHTAAELCSEGSAAGLLDGEALGVEGPWAYALDYVPAERLETCLEQAVVAAGTLERDPRAIDLSAHLLLSATAP